MEIWKIWLCECSGEVSGSGWRKNALRIVWRWVRPGSFAWVDGVSVGWKKIMKLNFNERMPSHSCAFGSFNGCKVITVKTFYNSFHTLNDNFLLFSAAFWLTIFFSARLKWVALKHHEYSYITHVDYQLHNKCPFIWAPFSSGKSFSLLVRLKNKVYQSVITSSYRF